MLDVCLRTKRVCCAKFVLEHSKNVTLKDIRRDSTKSRCGLP